LKSSLCREKPYAIFCLHAANDGESTPENDLSDTPEGFLNQLLRTAASVVGTALEAFNGLLEKAYSRGYEDGASAMRDSLLRAAQAPLNIPPMPDLSSIMNADTGVSHQNEVKDVRAPRGSIGRFVTEALKRQPGLTQTSLKEMAIRSGAAYPGIGNELRRHEGIKYRKDAKKRWYLIEVQPSASAGEPTLVPSAHEVQQAAE
jgi:hypothetical protein